MLARWSEAFDAATAAKPGVLKSRNGKKKVGLLWLRLEQKMAAPEQLAAVIDKFGQIPCVVMSDTPQDEEALAVFSAGARGYCNTHADPLLLRQIAAVVLQGGLWIGESLMQRLIGATARLSKVAPGAASASSKWQQLLTDREREVAQTLATGASNKEIARLLGITDRTVKAHVGAILEKLKVRDRLQLSLIINGGGATASQTNHHPLP